MTFLGNCVIRKYYIALEVLMALDFPVKSYIAPLSDPSHIIHVSYFSIVVTEIFVHFFLKK